MIEFTEKYVKDLCLTDGVRIPLEIRKSKKIAKEFLDFIYENKIEIKNSHIYFICNWIGYKIQKFNKIDKFCEIENIDYIGKRNTFDLSINDGNSYVANGIVCHNTLNLPEDVSEEVVSKVYETGWKSGCKGITVYREGSRSGVLISANEKKAEEKEKLFEDHHAPKRPKKMEAEVIKFQNNHEKWIAVIGTLDGRPYEFFAGKLEGLSAIPNFVDKGYIIKARSENGVSRYDFQYEDKDGYNITIEGLSRSFDKEYWNYAKMISGVLRHGMPLPYVVDLISSLNLQDDTLNTWKNGVTRVIKRFISDGTNSNNKCPECKQDSLIFQEGCLICKNCGNSKCGS